MNAVSVIWNSLQIADSGGLLALGLPRSSR